MTPVDPVVFLVDDDPSVLTALQRLVRSVGLDVQAFDDPLTFLDQAVCERPCCLVLDVRMPHMSGLELQEKMTRKGISIPIIFITGYGSVKVSVRAMRAGAVHFLEKPFEEEDLLAAIQEAVEEDLRRKKVRAEIRLIQKKVDSLTPRELDVFKLVAAGMSNKQIASELGNSIKTVKVHRHRVMKKMKADSLAALVQMAVKSGTETTRR